MRKLVVATFVSLDGVVQAPGGAGEDPSDGFSHEGGWCRSSARPCPRVNRGPARSLLGAHGSATSSRSWPKMPRTRSPGLIGNEARRLAIAPRRWTGRRREALLKRRRPRGPAARSGAGRRRARRCTALG